MKAKDLKGKKGDDLNKLLTEKKDALRSFKTGASGSKSRNVKEGKNIKKDIARILTVINQK